MCVGGGICSHACRRSAMLTAIIALPCSSVRGHICQARQTKEAISLDTYCCFPRPVLHEQVGPLGMRAKPHIAPEPPCLPLRSGTTPLPLTWEQLGPTEMRAKPCIGRHAYNNQSCQVMEHMQPAVIT